jgi:hypothetical protein
MSTHTTEAAAMITVKRLMKLLAECPPDTQVFAFAGEFRRDPGTTR